MPTAPSSPTAAPTAPDRTDRPTFSARATAWADYQKVSLVPQMYGLALNAYANAVEANASAVAALASQNAAAVSEVNAAAYANSTGTSAQSKTIAVAQFTFTDVPTGRAWVPGMPVVAYASATAYMLCTVNSYAGSTLVLDAGAVVGSGSFAAWSFFGQPYPRYPILAAAAAAVHGVSSSETLENELVSTGLGAVGVNQIIFGNALFVAAGGSNANVATSPDLDIFTLRAMPSTALWQIATNGTDKFLASVASATTMAKSTDATTWAAATALPGTAHASASVPCFNGNTCMIVGSAATTAYTTTDNGTSYGTQTLPASAGGSPFAIGGLFWYYNTGTNAYTSATGATGTYTLRTLPVTPSVIWQDYDGSICILASGATTVYRSTDGINWSAMAQSPRTANTPFLLINGVYGSFSTTFGSAATYHVGGWIARTALCNYNGASVVRVAKNTAGTLFAVPTTGSAGMVGRVAPTATDAATALFSR